MKYYKIYYKYYKVYKKLQKIISDIYEMNGTDLSAIIDAVKLRRNQLHTSDAHQFRVGDRVSFAGRHGSTLKGVVEKIKIKYVLVRTDTGTRWNVPGSHLTKEAVNA